MVTKGFEYFDIVSSDRKDTETLENKKKIWELIAMTVNQVNTSNTIRDWKDACSKWTQLKCQAKGSDALKRQFEVGDVR